MTSRWPLSHWQSMAISRRAQIKAFWDIRDEKNEKNSRGCHHKYSSCRGMRWKMKMKSWRAMQAIDRGQEKEYYAVYGVKDLWKRVTKCMGSSVEWMFWRIDWEFIYNNLRHENLKVCLWNSPVLDALVSWRYNSNPLHVPSWKSHHKCTNGIIYCELAKNIK